MALFNFVAKDKKAKTVKGREEASSEKNLVSKLRSRGLFVISVEPEGKGAKKGPAGVGSKRGKRNSIKLVDLAFLARNLATMLSGGVTLLRSLGLASYQSESFKLSKVLRKCTQDVRNGFSFGEALKKHPSVFSTLWVGIIDVGEASGNLPSVLNKLADYLDLRMEFERKIKGALIYPIILVCAAAIAVGIFIKVIFPKFAELFSQFQIELPALTKMILATGDFLAANFYFIAGGLVLAGIAVNYFRKSEEGKKIVDRVVLKLPFIGNLLFLIYIERFTSIIHILLESGLPLVYTLDVSSKSIGNYVLQGRLNSVTENVKEGSSLSEELTRIGIFPLLVSEMAKIGEEVGNMPELFKKVSLHYRRVLAAKIDRFIAAFEPLMVIFMGIVIGTIIVALFLPLFKLSTLQ